ncbi:conserved protein of unknown function [Burkholderia multivorans]
MLLYHSDYSYTAGYTGYMRVITDYIREHLSDRKRSVLDIPAGSGVFARGLADLGHDVTKADIHSTDGFVYANMEARLPFEDATFDVVTCLEGVEHVINPVNLLQDLVRITQRGGHVVISTPNITSFWSRVQFLFTGTFFLFSPNGTRQTHGQPLDRGHISPFTPLQLCYLMGAFGAELVDVRTDKAKKKALAPIYMLMKPISRLWLRHECKGIKKDSYPGVRDVIGLLTGFTLAFGRSQILIFKVAEGASSDAVAAPAASGTPN